MRLLTSLLLSFIFPACLYAQQKSTANQLPKQLKTVIAEASNGFKSLKGEEVKEREEDETFTSKITLQGTTDNQIMDFDTGGTYMATLGETTDTSIAQALLDTWKKKITGIVGSHYEVTIDNQVSDEAEKRGYLLLSDKVSISIYYNRYKEEETISVFLLIMRV
jgi:hypothetical protein